MDCQLDELRELGLEHLTFTLFLALLEYNVVSSLPINFLSDLHNPDDLRNKKDCKCVIVHHLFKRILEFPDHFYKLSGLCSCIDLSRQ